jgi:transcriptional regulator with XRE-family HTH domain
VDIWDLKKWRRKLGLTQYEAAEKLNVSRATIQHWELEHYPIPYTTELACQLLTRRWKQRPEFGPVTLIYADGPVWQQPEGGHHVRSLHCESHSNNESAIKRARSLIAESGFRNPAIIEETGEVIWDTPELLQECGKPIGERLGSAQNSIETPKPKNNEATAHTTPQHVSNPAPWWQLLYGNRVVTGRQIRAARALIGWSQAELARASGVSKSTVIKFESSDGYLGAWSKPVRKIWKAMEEAGVDFFEEDGGGEGVRLRSHRKGT